MPDPRVGAVSPGVTGNSCARASSFGSGRRTPRSTGAERMGGHSGCSWCLGRLGSLGIARRNGFRTSRSHPMPSVMRRADRLCVKSFQPRCMSTSTRFSNSTRYPVEEQPDQPRWKAVHPQFAGLRCRGRPTDDRHAFPIPVAEGWQRRAPQACPDECREVIPRWHCDGRNAWRRPAPCMPIAHLQTLRRRLNSQLTGPAGRLPGRADATCRRS